jgi:hypothetical protein
LETEALAPISHVIAGGRGESTPVIPVLGRLIQEDHEFQANLGYVRTSHFKKKK